MNWLRTVAREVFGLFIDDSSFALAILFLMGIVWFATSQVAFFNEWGGVVLFSGLGVILIESCLRTARGHWARIDQ